MKIGKLDLRYFKRFQRKTLDFYDEAGLPKDLIVLIGDNGTGKSSILQAIALTIGTATRRLKEPDDLDWLGFDIDLASKSWQFPQRTPNIECEIFFNEDELEAIHYCYDLTSMANDPSFIRPGNSNLVTLNYFVATKQVRTTGSHAEMFQFLGREYAKQVLSQIPDGLEVFRRIGGIFWYTEQRTATSLSDLEEENGSLSINNLRQRLSEWENLHLRINQGSYQLKSGQRDRFSELEEAYKILFPDRNFDGTLPREYPEEATKTSWFVLSQNGRQYEISEMSGAERALFPFIFDFANWGIHRSIILIDEIELHLHPPLQQAFLRGLQNLGNDNQIIITTHSESIVDIVPQSCIYRL